MNNCNRDVCPIIYINHSEVVLLLLLKLVWCFPIVSTNIKPTSDIAHCVQITSAVSQLIYKLFPSTIYFLVITGLIIEFIASIRLRHFPQWDVFFYNNIFHLSLSNIISAIPIKQNLRRQHLKLNGIT